MSQLLVRKIEPAIVHELRRRAADQGVSVEEAHRRLLRSALLGDIPEAGKNLVDYLRTIPQGDGVEFERDRSLPRELDLP
jgi:plasmid stability protein